MLIYDFPATINRPTTFKVKRIYEEASSSDGRRVLVDRLWPRGVSRESARIDDWLKDVAPSNELRKWFGHEPEKWAELKKRYREELKRKEAVLADLRVLGRKGAVTLLYGAKDTEHNQAVALKEFLDA